MLKTKQLALLAGLITVSIGLFLLFTVDSSTTEVKFTSESPQTLQTTKTEPTTAIQSEIVVPDPFKKFLEEKSNKTSSSVRSDNPQSIPVQPGKDPFKEFLDKQKQNSKDQVVSPFGKN
jgi:hypothetical protein